MRKQTNKKTKRNPPTITFSNSGNILKLNSNPKTYITVIMISGRNIFFRVISFIQKFIVLKFQILIKTLDGFFNFRIILPIKLNGFTRCKKIIHQINFFFGQCLISIFKFLYSENFRFKETLKVRHLHLQKSLQTFYSKVD